MKVLRGLLINPVSPDEISIYRDGCLAVDAGRIIFSGNFADFEFNPDNTEISDLKEKFILPGLVDVHTHLPQHAIAGIGKGELLPWLNDYIFPIEKRFFLETYSRDLSDLFFPEIISKGTSTAAIYGSIHEGGTGNAFEKAEEYGLRVFMGISLIDRKNEKDYFQSRAENIAAMEFLEKMWHGRNDGLLNYSVIPRYAGSCTSELMKEAAEFAAEKDLLIQTHISENYSELEFIKSLYPDYGNYAEIYNSHDLLGSKTVLAHCIHLSDEEIEILKSRDCKIAHCPASNRFLKSGIMPLAKYLKMGFKTGLGTDVAGGYNFSVLDEAREAVESSKMLNFFKPGNDVITPENAFFMATLGGAQVLGISEETGSLDAGKSADYLVVKQDPILIRHREISDSELIAHLLYGDREIVENNIRGKNLIVK
jgi:guanine deaminase